MLCFICLENKIESSHHDTNDCEMSEMQENDKEKDFETDSWKMQQLQLSFGFFIDKIHFSKRKSEKQICLIFRLRKS